MHLHRYLGAVPVFLRHVRAEPGVLAVLLVAVAITTFVAAGSPRWLEVRSDQALRGAVASAPPDARNLMALRRSVIPPGRADHPMGPITAFGQRFLEDLEPSIRSVIADSTWLVQADVMTLSLTQPALPEDVGRITFTRQLHLRRQKRIDEHVRIVDGRAPRPTDETVANPFQTPVFGGDDVHVVEVALSGRSLEELRVEVGQRLLLTPQPGPCCPSPIFVDIVGQLEVTDPGSDYWYDDRVAEPAVVPEGDSQRVTAYGVFAEDAYPGVIAALNEQPLTNTWRYEVDPELIGGGALEQLSTDLRQLDAERGQVSARTDVTQVISGLLGIFARVGEQLRMVGAVLTLAAIGVLAIALTVIGLAGRLLAQRRRPTVELMRGRGASPAQVLAAYTVEALVVAVPAALIACLSVVVIVEGRTVGASWLMTALVALSAVALPVLAAVPDARRPLLQLRRGDPGGRHVSPRRLVIEGLVVVLALAGVVLLRRRGLGGDAGLDPFLASAPVLLGLATGLLVLRLYPIPMRALAWAAGRRRDVVPVLGLRRIVRLPGATAAPLLVLVLAVAVAVFCSVLLHTLEHRQAGSAWQEVGADLRVDARGVAPLPDTLDVSGVPGVETVAPALYESEVPALSGGAFSNVDLVAVDGARYAPVLGDAPGEPELPAGVLDSGAGTGTVDEPLPAIVSARWLQGAAAPGDRFRLRLAGREVDLLVHAVRDRFPSVPVGGPFVVTSLGALDAAIPDRTLRPNRLYVGGDVSGVVLQEELDEQQAGAVVASRADVLTDIRDAPLVAGTVWGLRFAVVLSAVYAALAIGLAMTLTSRARHRDLSYLRTLGLSERQALGLPLVELGPVALIATVVGSGLGIVTAYVITPGLDLAILAGVSAPGGLAVDLLKTSLLAGAVLATAGVGAVAISARARRTDLSKTLRMGDA